MSICNNPLQDQPGIVDKHNEHMRDIAMKTLRPLSCGILLSIVMSLLKVHKKYIALAACNGHNAIVAHMNANAQVHNFHLIDSYSYNGSNCKS